MELDNRGAHEVSFEQLFQVLETAVSELALNLESYQNLDSTFRTALNSAAAELVKCYFAAESTASILDDNKVFVKQTEIINLLKSKNPLLARVFNAITLYYRGQRIGSVGGKWSEIQSGFLSSSIRELRDLPSLLRSAGLTVLADDLVHYCNDLDDAAKDDINNYIDNKSTHGSYERKKDTFSNIKDLIRSIDRSKVTDSDGKPLIPSNIGEKLQSFLKVIENGYFSLSLSRTSKDELNWEKGQYTITDLQIEIERICDLYLVAEVKTTKPDLYDELQKIREIVFRILHENNVNIAQARNLDLPVGQEIRRLLRPSTKLIPAEIYGEMMMFMGEVAGEISIVEKYGVAVSLGDQFYARDRKELLKVLQRFISIKKRYSRALASPLLSSDSQDKTQKLVEQIDGYVQWVRHIMDTAEFVDNDRGEDHVFVYGDIERPTIDTESAYVEWLKKRMNAAKEHPQILNAIYLEIRQFILERLNLKFESTHPKWSDSAIYTAYCSFFSTIDISSKDKNYELLLKIKIKAEEMEYVRRITDVAQLGGRSDAMVTNPEEFGKQEGLGLKISDYDYFLQKWGDGTVRNQEEGGKENAYKYHKQINNTIFAFLEWLRLGTIPENLRLKAIRDQAKKPAANRYPEATAAEREYDKGTMWSDGSIWKGKAKKFCVDYLNLIIEEAGLKPERDDLAEAWGLIYNICYGLGIRMHSFIDSYACARTPTSGMSNAFNTWVKPLQLLPDDRYQVYKGPRYIPFHEVFVIPEGWHEDVEAAGLPNEGRLSNIHKSLIMSENMVDLMGERPEQVPIGDVYEDRTRPMTKNEKCELGRRIASPYLTLFEFVVLKAESRRKEAIAQKAEDHTFRGYLDGHAAFVAFASHVRGVPGSLWEPQENKPIHEALDEVVNKVNGMEIEALLSLLINDFRKLIESDVSRLKTFWFAVDRSQVAHAVAFYIRKMFRVLGQHADVKVEHRIHLLHEIVEIVKVAENIRGLATIKDTYLPKGFEGRLAFYEEKITQRDGTVKTIHRRPNDADMRDLILMGFPQTDFEYHGPNIIGKAMSRTKARVKHKPTVLVGGTPKMRRSLRVSPIKSKTHRVSKRIDAWLDKRKYELGEPSLASVIGVFGAPQKPEK